MATTKPRLTITLNPHTSAVISELSRLQNKPKAHIITELLDSVVPVLERTAYILQLANRASTGVNDDIKGSMERAEAKLKLMMDDAMGQMDMVSGLLSDAADEGKQSASETAGLALRSEGLLPPHSNTGVDFGDNSEKPSKINN
jgi:hypothetical protein